MLPVFTGEEMRRVDERAVRDLHISGATLMENAGRGAADAVLAWLAPGKRAPRAPRVVIVCGKGGNGGDGFVVARHLKRRGVRCDVVLAAPARSAACPASAAAPVFPTEPARTSR